MFVGSLQVELLIPGCQSLKEKRFVLKSIISRVRNKFNVSISEIDYLDKWQRSILGISVVSNKKQFTDDVLNKVLDFIMTEPRIQIIDQFLEIY